MGIVTVEMVILVFVIAVLSVVGGFVVEAVEDGDSLAELEV